MNESGFCTISFHCRHEIGISESESHRIASPRSFTKLVEEQSLYFLLEHFKIQAGVSLNDLFAKDKLCIEFYQDLLTSCLCWSVNRGQSMSFDMVVTVTTSWTECSALWAFYVHQRNLCSVEYILRKCWGSYLKARASVWSHEGWYCYCLAGIFETALWKENLHSNPESMEELERPNSAESR